MAAMVGDHLGRYLLEAEIGRGGMSVVYRAHDPRLDRRVAVKVLHPHLADRAESRERFHREAQAAARLDHPNIVEVHDFAPPDSERAYIISELIDGPTIRAFVEDHPILRPEVAALMMLPVFEALQHAHDAGIIHRDVKPENIMIRGDGVPILMDFGIAQMVDMETLTATGTMLGSPAHMAPEIVEGEAVGAPADVFSAGTVLYWLVCGALPFSGPNPAALFRRILECRFDPVLQRRPHAGRSLARLIESCLARSAGERPESAQAVADRLRELLAEAGLTDLQAELQAFLADPEVYQEALGWRVLPRYVERAKAAYDARATARALDLLDRALAIDERHEEARALLHKIERGRRAAGYVRAAGAAAVLLVVVGLGYGLFVRPALLQQPADEPDATISTATGPLDAAIAAPPEPDAAPAEPDAAPPEPDAAAPEPDASRPVVARRPTRPTPRTPTRPPPTRPVDAAVAAPTVRVQIKGNPKTAEVWVDGERRGAIFNFEQAGSGLELTAGKHTFEFRHPSCARKRRTVRVQADRNAPIAWRCDKLPAVVTIESTTASQVYDDSGNRLGLTNSPIEVAIAGGPLSLRQRVTLTVKGEGNRLARRTLTITAGERHTTKVPF